MLYRKKISTKNLPKQISTEKHTKKKIQPKNLHNDCMLTQITSYNPGKLFIWSVTLILCNRCDNFIITEKIIADY